jgi:hypothetical protein
MFWEDGLDWDKHRYAFLTYIENNGYWGKS